MGRTGGILVTLAALAALAAACSGSTAKAPVPEGPARPAVRERFADRAPATTRVMAQLVMSDGGGYAEVIAALIQGVMLEAGTAETCGEPWTRIERVRGAAGPGAFFIEADGKIGIADVACVLGQAPPADGRIVMGDFVITEREGGGLRATDHEGFERGAPAALAARFEAGAGGGGGGVFVAGELGAPGREVKLDMTLSAAGSRIVIDLGDAARVDRLHGLVERAAAVVRLQEGGTVEVKRAGTAVTIDWSFGSGRSDSVVLQTSVIEAFKIPSISMWPSFEIDDFVYVLKGDLQEPVQRGEVVVFRNKSRAWVGRVAALGGQRIQVERGRVTVDGVAVPQERGGVRTSHDRDDMSEAWEPFTAGVATERVGAHTYAVAIDDERGPPVDLVVPPGHFFMLGDNRPNSNDSRNLGTFPLSDVVGTVAVTWLSLGPEGVRWDRVMTAAD